jgi:hypothetical protein
MLAITLGAYAYLKQRIPKDFLKRQTVVFIDSYQNILFLGESA